MLQKIPPQAIDLEKALLGGLMLEKDGMDKIVEILSPEIFYHNGNRIIYEAMLALFSKNEPIDFHTLMNQLKVTGKLSMIGDETYLMELLEGVVSSVNLEQHAKILKEKFIMRELITTSNQIIQNCYEQTNDVDELLDTAETNIFNLAQNRVKKGFVQIKNMLPQTFDEIAKYSKEGVNGVPSGFTELDEMLSGFQNSDLLILAARPSMGKTALALSIAANMGIRYNKAVGIFSLEMSSPQLIQRILCSEARINMHSLRTGKLPHRDYPKLSLAAGPLAEAPIFIDDSPSMNILEVRAKSRRMKSQHNIDFIMIDYLQLLKGAGLRSENREQEISQISRSLKALAKELNIPVLALSQLNRRVEDRTNARPQLADLRESGAIEQDADVVMFIYREELYKPDTAEPGKAEIIIGKQRNGPVGTVKTTFIKDYVRFENYTARHPEESQVF
ncbi:MAG: replicative DNA helicase [bacterium]